MRSSTSLLHVRLTQPSVGRQCPQANTCHAAAVELIVDLIQSRSSSLGVCLFYAQGFTYNYDNPTAATLAEVNPTWHLSKFIGVDNGLGRIKRYQQQDARTTFMSTFPVRRLFYSVGCGRFCRRRV